jgi:hypothetical protein
MTYNRTAFGTFVLIVLISGPLVRAQVGEAGTQPDSGFQRRLELQYSRLTSMKKWDASLDGQLKSDIAGLTDRYILGRLNGRTPSAPGLQRDLNEAFSQAIGHMSSEELKRFWGEIHYASVLGLGAQRGGFLIGYMVPHGNTSLDVIEVAEQVSGTYGFSARGGGEMQDHTLSLALMRCPNPGHVRFVAYGARLGANDSPLAVVLYEFDGKSLSALWSRSELWQGSVKVEPDSVMLTFRDVERFAKGTPPYFLQEKYKGAGTGLKLVSRHWIDRH